jgi:hypothetical protein
VEADESKRTITVHPRTAASDADAYYDKYE